MDTEQKEQLAQIERDQQYISNSMTTLRYFKEDLPPRIVSSKRKFNKVYQEQIYGLKLSETEKTRQIVAMVNAKKIERAKERKREKKRIQKKIEKQKERQKMINKRKHLEGKWRKKMMKLSVDLVRGRVQDGHWRRHEWEREHSGEIKSKKKKILKNNKILASELKYRKRILSAAQRAVREGEDVEEVVDEEYKKLKPKKKKTKRGKNSKSLAFLAPYKLKGRKIYTKKELKKLQDKTSMKFFKNTNTYGLTKSQQKVIKKKQEEKRPPEIVITSEIKDFQRHILRKRVIKRYKKVKKRPQLEEDEDGEGEEENMEEEQVSEDHEENDEENKENEEKKPEVEKEETDPANKEENEPEDGRYKPLYPEYKENEGVSDIEVEEGNEEQKDAEEEQNEAEEEQNGDGEKQNGDGEGEQNGDGEEEEQKEEPKNNE